MGGHCHYQSKDAIASEGGEILRTKEAMEAIAAKALLLGMKLKSPEAQPAAGDGKTKRKKVVKRMLPPELINQMVATPFKIIDEIPDDKLAKYPQFYREFYAEQRAMSAKVMAYQQALIDQYNDKGYAEDETAVAEDDEVEMMEN